MKKRILLYLLLVTIYSNPLFSQSLLSEDFYWDAGAFPDLEWTNANNWGGDATPNTVDDVFINNDKSANISSGNNITVESLALGADNDNDADPMKHPGFGPPKVIFGTSGQLTIASGATLTTTKGTHEGSDCVRIEGVSGNESSLIINGTFNVQSAASGDGLDVGNYTSVVVGVNGVLNITANGKSGINLKDDLSNSGDISITALPSGDDGIKFSGPIAGSKVINNSGASITIDGGGYMKYGINLNSVFDFDNFGTVTVSNISTDTILEGGMTFNNYGTLAGDGSINPQNLNAAGSTISPGTPTTPIGKLTFEKSVNLTGIDLHIQVNGLANFDQLGVGLIGSINITNANLILSGTYTPVVGDEFMFINNTSGNPITGTFFNLPEGSTTTLNGVDLTVSYNGGDGNDITFTMDAPLPVELVDFNAQPLKNEVKLAWVTASEINNDFFTIERSLDGRSFEAITKIAGNGTTTRISKYSYMDKNPHNGFNYYRLKQTDYDGQFSYSDIKTVDFRSDETIKVYPTIVSETITIESGNNMDDDELTIIIQDLAGRQYESFIFSTNSNKKEILLCDLSPGGYFLLIYSIDFVETHKFIKQ